MHEKVVELTQHFSTHIPWRVTEIVRIKIFKKSHWKNAKLSKAYNKQEMHCTKDQGSQLSGYSCLIGKKYQLVGHMMKYTNYVKQVQLH